MFCKHSLCLCPAPDSVPAPFLGKTELFFYFYISDLPHLLWFIFLLTRISPLESLMGTLSLVISNIRDETIGAEQRYSVYLEENVTISMWQVPVKATSIPWDQCQSVKNNPNLDFAHAIRSQLLTVIFLLLQNDPSTGYPQNKPRKKNPNVLMVSVTDPPQD